MNETAEERGAKAERERITKLLENEFVRLGEGTDISDFNLGKRAGIYRAVLLTNVEEKKNK
jgi:hypothetical protein